MINESLNCPNCGAVRTGSKCEYCGTVFEFGKAASCVRPTQAPASSTDRFAERLLYFAKAGMLSGAALAEDLRLLVPPKKTETENVVILTRKEHEHTHER